MLSRRRLISVVGDRSSVLHVRSVLRLHASKSVTRRDSRSSDTVCSPNDRDGHPRFQIAANLRVRTMPFLREDLGKFLQREVGFFSQHPVTGNDERGEVPTLLFESS